MVRSSLQSSSKTAATGCGVTTAPCHCHCVRHSHSSLFYRNDRFVLPVEQLNPLRILMGKYSTKWKLFVIIPTLIQRIFFCVFELLSLMWKVYPLNMEDIVNKTLWYTLSSHRKHVVFGRVVSGEEVVTAIENLPVDNRSRPLQPAVIANCGELILQRSSKVKGQCLVCTFSSSLEMLFRGNKVFPWIKFGILSVLIWRYFLL